MFEKSSAHDARLESVCCPYGFSSASWSAAPRLVGAFAGLGPWNAFTVYASLRQGCSDSTQAADAAGLIGSTSAANASVTFWRARS